MQKCYKQCLSVTLLAITVTACHGDKKGNEKPMDTMYTGVRGGDLVATDTGKSLYTDIVGHANLMVSTESSTVQLYATGLSANKRYAAHVHNDVCSAGGGGHYLQNLDGEDVAENGLWPALDTDMDGMAMTEVEQPFMVRADAKSVVIHEPGSGDRIACADLYSSTTLMGGFMAINSGVDTYEMLSGSAYVSNRSDNTAVAQVSVMGLTANATYPAHVHVGDCESLGGAHYLQDSGGEDMAENGLWPVTMTNEFGYGMGWASNPFNVRMTETQSIILHDPDTGERIACADLDDELLAFRSGGFMPTSDGNMLYGDDVIQGNAMLSISPMGESMVHLTVKGLMPNTSYASHVHNGVCESGGGSHYLQMMDGEDVAENGLWPAFTTGDDGVGERSVTANFIVRNDARSVVIHEPGSGARIACADLM